VVACGNLKRHVTERLGSLSVICGDVSEVQESMNDIVKNKRQKLKPLKVMIGRTDALGLNI
jgi:hypothetical protein